VPKGPAHVPDHDLQRRAWASLNKDGGSVNRRYLIVQKQGAGSSKLGPSEIRRQTSDVRSQRSEVRQARGASPLRFEERRRRTEDSGPKIIKSSRWRGRHRQHARRPPRRAGSALPGSKQGADVGIGKQKAGRSLGSSGFCNKDVVIREEYVRSISRRSLPACGPGILYRAIPRLRAWLLQPSAFGRRRSLLIADCACS
jgi:hypothetical protein